MERRQINLDTDLHALAEMQARSWEINFPDEVFVEPLFRDVVVAALNRSDSLYAYVEDERLVGWLWLDWRIGRRRAHIRHVQVDEELWGQGYGKRIVCDAIQLAREHERWVLSLNVTKSNQRAVRLYRGLGFRIWREMGPRQEMRLDLRGGEAPLDPAG